MDLERVAAVIRPRSYGESIDLGFLMVRAWWRPIFGAWVIQVLPVFALLLLCAYRHPWLAALFLWWLKPLLDRAPLFVVSRALFGTIPTAAQTARALPGLLRPDLLRALTWLRLDPVRAFRLPIWQLEGLRGARRTTRTRTLTRQVQQDALTLTGVCLLFEVALTLLPIGVTFAMLPAGQMEVWGLAWGDPASAGHFPLRWAVTGCWVLAFSIIEPFYVAAGFALYINRRTRLEAWDLEVAFRRLAGRLATPGKRRAAASVVLACLLCVTGGVAAETGTAEPAAGTAEPAADAAGGESFAEAEAIREVLSDPVFGGERTESYLQFRFQRDDPAPSGLGKLFGLGAGAAWLISRFLWVTLVVSLVALVIRLVIAAQGRAPRTALPDPAEPPDRILGMNVREESLPADLVGEARGLWSLGDRQGAIRLLYRGALSRLIADGVAIRTSATEGDCLRLASTGIAGDGYAYFRRLTETWQLGSYGHREPTDEAGESLLSGWTSHFGRPS